MIGISKYKKYIPYTLYAIVFGFSIWSFFFIDSNNIIEYIGYQNAYLMMFVISLIGGLSTFNFVPYYSIIILLVSAGLNPLLVGLASAAGIVAGDSFSYYMGYTSGHVIPVAFKRIFDKITTLAQTNTKMFLVVCFIYGSISPLSNDILTIPAGIAQIPYRKIMVPLGLGNLVFNVSIAYLAIYGTEYIHLLIG